MIKGKSTNTSNKLVAVVGETAAGKSQFALNLAKLFNGEIIAADSWTVRRDLDVGTAKPSQADQLQIPHHMLDIVTPCQDFNAAQFKSMALQHIQEVQRRGAVPVLAGGTGLYIDSVLFDYSFAPPADEATRQIYNAMTQAELLQLAEQKKLSTANIDTRNKRRIIRLLETNGAQPNKKALRPDTLVIGVELDRAALHQRIEQRVLRMIEQGLEAEVKQLISRYGWECEGLKGIGYREWQPYFVGSASLEEVTQDIIRSTKQLAKRQRTWFRTNKHINWCSSYTQAEQQMDAFMQNQ